MNAEAASLVLLCRTCVYNLKFFDLSLPWALPPPPMLSVASVYHNPEIPLTHWASLEIDVLGTERLAQARLTVEQ